MKRKILFLWGPVLSLAILAGGLGLLRVYLAEAAELLVADLTGAGAEVSSVDVIYFPPSVTIRGLKFDTGSERISAPRVDLYPNFSEIFSGEVTLDRAILEEPLIRASKSVKKAASESGATMVDTTFLPKVVSIRNASFIVDDKGIPSSPVSFSADLEKGSGGIEFLVRNAAIPEFGLVFNGSVDVVSMEPLNLKVQGEKGTFDPSALIDFLHRFNYVDPDELVMFKETKRIEADGFSLDFDADSRAVAFAAKAFVFDNCALSDFATTVDSKGGWTLACKEGSLDAAQLLALTRAHPEGGKALVEGLKGMGLKDVAAEGSIRLVDVQLKTRSAKARPSGTLTLATPALKVSLTSIKDATQDMTLNNLDGVVTFKNGKPQVSIKRLDLASSAGGSGAVTVEMPVPFALAGTRFQAEARQLVWFGTALDGSASKKNGRQIDFDLSVKSAETLVQAKGLARNEFSGSNRWAVVMDNLELNTGTAESDAKADAGPSEAPFNFDFVRGNTLSGKLVVRRLQYNDLPVVRDLSAKISSAKDQLLVRGKGRLCLMRVELETLLTPGSVAANVAVKSNAVQLPGVLGCFVDELPVYLRGRLTVMAKFSMQGKSARELTDSVRGDVVAKLRDLNVLKLANLDKRLGFFVEIMNAVDLDADKGDTLTFRDGLITAKVAGDDVNLTAVRLSGSQLSVVGKGNFGLKEKRLRFDAHAVTPYGVNKDISIDSVLSEEKAS